MSRRKRSGRLTALAAGLVLVAGCGDAAPVKADVVARWRPVAVADESAEWVAGVRSTPLKPGQSLLFWFGDKRSPEWTMSGVRYPLVLRALDAAGEPVGEPVLMKPCRMLCKPYKSPESAFAWVETRPKTRR